MTWREPNIETMPGRMLIGRPEGALARVTNYSDLFKACKFISDAYRKSAPDLTEWQIHIIFIRRHDLRCVENLVHVDTALMDIGADPATFLADRVAEGIEMLRGANMARDEQLGGIVTEESTVESQGEGVLDSTDEWQS